MLDYSINVYVEIHNTDMQGCIVVAFDYYQIMQYPSLCFVLGVYIHTDMASTKRRVEGFISEDIHTSPGERVHCRGERWAGSEGRVCVIQCSVDSSG